MLVVSQEIRINVRTTAQIKRDLETTAQLRGLTVSALVNSLVVKAIREEKQVEPQAFRKGSVQEINNEILFSHLEQGVPVAPRTRKPMRAEQDLDHIMPKARKQKTG